MDSRVTVAVALLVLTAAVAVTGPVAGAAVADETATPTPTATPAAENGTNESEFGATVSAFMQASAAETEGSVDNGMWAASFNRANASERPELVQNRTGALERRAARLAAERAALLNESDGEVTVQERAKAARLAARIDTLRDAINTTAEAAAETGVNQTRLNELRNRAGELSGPEVARMARNLTFGPPGQANGGPNGAPGTDRPGNAADRPGNSTDETESTDGNATDADGGAGNETVDGGGDAGNGPGSAGGNDGQGPETEDD